MEILGLLLFVPFLFSSLLAVTGSGFNVVDYGAIGDGRTDDTNAFVKTWQEACASSSSSSIIQVPSNRTFLIRPLQFNGPCKSNNVTVEIDGNLVAPTNPSKWKCKNHKCHQWIYFHRVNNLTVRGHGTIDGRGHRWWWRKHHRRPTALEISNSENVSLGGGLTFKDSPMMHVALHRLKTLFVSNITIIAPKRSPNTDGIHVSSSTNVFINNSRIGTGDDCISIVGDSSNVTISNIICGPGHGISIGSLGKNGANDKVEYVRVSDVVFIGADNGARIKTWQGGRGYARHILFERVLSHNTSNPIIIDQFYCDHQHCVPSEEAVEITNVTYRRVLGTSRTKSAVILNCSKTKPCRDIVIDDMHIIASDENNVTYVCNNVHGRARGEKVPQLSCLD